MVKKDFAAAHNGHDIAGFFSMLRPDRAPPPSRTAYASIKTGKVLQGCPFGHKRFGFGHGFTSSFFPKPRQTAVVLLRLALLKSR
jgi:hypothetical protein